MNDQPTESVPSVEAAADDAPADVTEALDGAPDSSEGHLGSSTDRLAPEDRDVAFERVAIGAATGRELSVTVGAIGAARADRVTVEAGMVGAVAAREAHLRIVGVSAVAAQDARIEQSFVRTVLGGRVHLGQGSVAGIVLAGRVDGPGRPLLDWRGGLALGAVAGVAWLLGRRLR